MGDSKMRIITALASILIILGALNWGIYGCLKVDLIANYFGGNKNPVGRALYCSIGLAGVYALLYVIFT